MSKILGAFVPEKTVAVSMPIGSVTCTIKSVVEVTDHDANLSGAKKENYRFADEHDQLAVTFIRKDGKPGIATHRMNTKGWKRFDQLSAKDQKSCTKDPEKGYAVNKKTGKRIEDEVRTAQCNNIMNQFLNKLTRNGEPIIDKLVAKGHLDADDIVGCDIDVTFEEEMYDGKPRIVATKFRKVSAAPVLSENSDQESY